MSNTGPVGAAGDARMLRGTWRRLILWSGGITLAILVVLGAAIYLSVDQSLSDSTQQRLQDRADQIAGFIGRAPGQDASLGPQLQTGIVFGGPSSGTLALVIGPANESVGPQNSRFDGLPDMAPSPPPGRASPTCARRRSMGRRSSSCRSRSPAMARRT